MKKLLLVVASLVMSACGGSDDSPEDTTIVGVYESSTEGAVEVIALYSNHAYVTCKHEGTCVSAGRYSYDASAEQLSLTDSATGMTTTMPAHVRMTKPAPTSGALLTRDLVTPGQDLTPGGQSQLTNGQSDVQPGGQSDVQPGGQSNVTPGGQSELTKNQSQLTDANGQELIQKQSAILCKKDPTALIDPFKLMQGEQKFEDMEAAKKALGNSFACRDAA